MAQQAKWATGEKSVVTYRLAYLDRQIALCRQHGTSAATGVPIGQVLRGGHRGYCYVCEVGPVADEAAAKALRGVAR